jgi:PD-(D/E)XK nuclease superfamily
MMAIHRPYAKDPNAPPSVTTVLDTMSKPGLSWAAAKETAQYAVNHTDWLLKESHMAVDQLRRHHRGVWDHRALLGTALHTVNSAWATGETLNVSALVDKMRAKSRLWARMEPGEIRTALRPMVSGLAQAWQTLEPKTVDVDRVVRTSGETLGYIGTYDWVVMVDGLTYLVDLKTTGKAAEKAKPFWDTWRLQLAAYRHASEVVNYEGREEVGTEAMPKVDRTAVLMVCADGSWQFLECSADHEEHAVFLALRAVYGWRKDQGEVAA